MNRNLRRNATAVNMILQVINVRAGLFNIPEIPVINISLLQKMPLIDNMIQNCLLEFLLRISIGMLFSSMSKKGRMCK
ncbi:MAG: hypothetical protein H6Q69_1856 [Firmicutes bacterium]|nr:hypothetical protein [Bacillota bacterium]